MYPLSQLNILLGFFASLYLSLVSAQRECAPQICSSCVPDGLINAPGIGFDLGTSYGTAAVRFHNGSTINIAKIAGDDEYTTLMQRYHTSPRPPPGYSAGNLREELREAWSSLKRDLNEWRGLPASPEAGILSSMLQQLRYRTEEKLGQKISSVGVTVPKLAGLYSYEICDALRYAGLKDVLIDSLNEIVIEPNAAFAGYGYGLCKRYTDILECEDEEEAMRMRRVIAIEFSEKTLAVALMITRTARSPYLESSEVSWDLGWGKRGEEVEVFWRDVTDRIRGVVDRFGKKVDTLVLLGDKAMEERFLAAVKDALKEFVVTEGEDAIMQVKKNDVDTVFIAARGTAELAKRNQESAKGCVEPEYCHHRGDDGKPPESREL
ncbi:hypothetical protein BDD12DRAFT_810696 [Trichophaea hybrida]|nr:hypothetical protein BDD12DRAFT_810696 [Trichophaea hybrida]